MGGDTEGASLISQCYLEFHYLRFIWLSVKFSFFPTLFHLCFSCLGLSGEGVCVCDCVHYYLCVQISVYPQVFPCRDTDWSNSVIIKIQTTCWMI